MSNFKQTKLLTENLKGYDGKANVIHLRSSWENKVVLLLQQLHSTNRIKGWNSEEIVFKYPKTIDNGLPHRYYMDFCVIKDDNNVVFVEVKPFAETYKPFPKKNMSDKQKIAYQKSLNTYITNDDKWTAVTKWCEDKNSKSKDVQYHFQIWTEKMIKPGQIRNYEMNKRFCNFPVFPIIPV